MKSSRRSTSPPDRRRRPRGPLFLLVIAFMIEAMSIAAYAAAPWRPELALGSPPLEGVPSSRVMAAASDSDMFVLWSDQRPPGTAAIFGTGIDQNGNVLSPFGVRMGMDGGALGIAWSGDSYVVLGARYSVGSTTAIDREGRVRRGPVAFGQIDNAWISANRNRTLIIGEYRANAWAGFVSSDGQVTTIGALPPGLRNVVILPRSGGFTVYAFDAEAPSACRMLRFVIEDSGAMREQVVGNWPNGSRFGAATNGSSDLLVWSWVEGHPKSTEGLDSYDTTDFLLLNQDGLVSQAAIHLSRLDLAWQMASGGGTPAATWDGRRFTVTYILCDGSTKSRLAVAGISSDGRVMEGSDAILDEAKNGPDGAGMTPVFASTASRRAMFWTRSQWTVGPETRTFMRTFDSFESLASAATVPLARSTAYQSQPALVSDHGIVYAAWRESTFPGRITNQLISPEGSASVPMTLSDGTLDAIRPAAAVGGGVVTTVWREEERKSSTPTRYRISFRRTGTNGALLDAAPVIVETSPYYSRPEKNGALDRVSVAWNGDHFVTAWTDGSSLMHFTRIGTDGIPLDFFPVLLLPGNTLGQINPKVVRVGNETVVLFFARISQYTADPLAIQGIVVHRDGSTGPVTTYVGATTTITETPAPFEAEWNGTDLVISWGEPAFGAVPTCIKARRFALNGTPSGAAVTLVCDSGNGNITRSGPADLVWDGWSWWYLMTSPDSVTVAQRLDVDLSPAGAPVPVSPWGAEVGAAVGVGSNGKLMLAYPRTDESEALTTRLFLQTLFTSGRERAAHR